MLDTATSDLLQPVVLGGLTLKNRIVMSPMTREYSPAGVPGPDVAAYYTRRAAGGTGLIVTEGVAIDHPTAVDSTAVPRLHGDAALAGWRRVVDDVHAAGGRIVPQLWHVGPLWGAMARVDPAVRPMRPSGLWGTPGKTVYPQSYIDASAAPTSSMTQADIDDVIAAYVRSARNAVDVGFDGIAIHAGHGYLLDAFLWADTNRRDDEWGGDLERRTRFPVAVVRAIRAEIGDDLPIWDEDTAPYDVLHPDAFLTLLDDSAPELIRAATLSMNQYWFSKTGSANLPARLKKAGCPEFAERVRRHTQGQEHALLKTTD